MGTREESARMFPMSLLTLTTDQNAGRDRAVKMDVKTHHKLLHQDRASTDETNGQISSINVLLKKERVFLKIIPVEISGPLGRLETYALLDEGSTTTLIERDVALK
ncbi:hypothetical protein EVAR_79002_1 [Eumeta japonica]|uniref:Peptidase aspartic putative domain-containing protein n=1 Tax=Eumeta variegata TaxID=151549 RepID=A0A4C1US73_EUMVA|nr:hypothetical protein EVAR_79002_1 [Eumeta japonica]